MHIRSLAQCEIDLEKFKKGDSIGDGGFGNVYQIESKDSEKKIFNKGY